MAKTRRQRGKHTRRVKRHSRRQKGGNSAWQSMMKLVGDGNTQWNNALMLKPEQNIVAKNSNNIVPVNNPNFGTGAIPNVSQMGGKKHRRKGKKGGYWGSLINQALVPFTLLGLQMNYGNRKTRRSAKH
jgi:hypothetical protein